MRLRAIGLIGLLWMGCQTTAPEAPCATDRECPLNTVCEGNRCVAVPCAEASPCKRDRLCQAGWVDRSGGWYERVGPR